MEKALVGRQLHQARSTPPHATPRPPRTCQMQPVIQGHLFRCNWKAAKRNITVQCCLAYESSEEDIVSKRSENRHFNDPTLIWRPLSGKHPRISTKTLYCQKLGSPGYIFVADSMGLSSYKFFFVVGSGRQVCNCNMALNGHSRSSKDTHLIRIERAYATSC